MTLHALLFAVVAAAPMADVSPYSVKRLADGSFEYAYDLTLVKAAGGSPDAIAAHGADAVKAFLKSLPAQTKLVLRPGAFLEISSGRALEAGRLATSFATIPTGPMASDNPLADKAKARLRPALDPAEPHLLLSAEAVAWQVRQIELSALGAEELETEALRRELWTRVLDRALQRQRTLQGDAREGALALAARVGAALACLDKTRVSASLRAEADVAVLIDAEVEWLSRVPDALLAPAPWNWRPDLECGWIRASAMGQPFARSRAGTAAVLTFIDLLEKDPHLGSLWDRVRRRRDVFLGVPSVDPIVEWRQKLTRQGEAAAAIDNLGDFIEALPLEARLPPPLVALPVTPFGRFFSELSGAERGNAVGELASALEDGRVSPQSSTWPQARDAALGTLCRSENNPGLRFDSGWRQRFVSSFETLMGAASESRSGSATGTDQEGTEQSELTVKLLVPPTLEVEPLPELYIRATQSLERLTEALKSEQLTGLKGLTPEGPGNGPVMATALSWIVRLKELAVLADPAPHPSKALNEARRLASGWLTEPAFGKDVREASASPVAMPGERQHAAIVGVGRRELVVTFSKPPTIESAGLSLKGLLVAPAEQRYIVPVLVSVGAKTHPTKRPMGRSVLKGLVDQASRDPEQVADAFKP